MKQSSRAPSKTSEAADLPISLPKDGEGAKALCGFKDRSVEWKNNPL